MKLSQLAQAAAPYYVGIQGDCQVQSLSQDSRLATQDGLFFCVSGATVDAHNFAQQAVDNGAIALVVTRYLPQVQVPQLLVSDDRAAMSLISAAFYGNPARQLKLIGITGTKGKTTSSFLVKSIL